MNGVVSNVVVVVVVVIVVVEVVIEFEDGKRVVAIVTGVDEGEVGVAFVTVDLVADNSSALLKLGFELAVVDELALVESGWKADCGVQDNGEAYKRLLIKETGDATSLFNCCISINEGWYIVFPT